MKMVYVAHPYSGKPENKQDCESILQQLQHDYPGYVFVAGVTSINCDYNTTPYHVGLALCLELLSRCEGILMTGKWKESTGCKAEMAFAQWRGLKIYDSLESLKEEFPCKE